MYKQQWLVLFGIFFAVASQVIRSDSKLDFLIENASYGATTLI